jgi:hypothetical protein
MAIAISRCTLSRLALKAIWKHARRVFEMSSERVVDRIFASTYSLIS